MGFLRSTADTDEMGSREAPEDPVDGNRRGRATRDVLVGTGWDLIDRLRLRDLLEAVPARKIADAAGRSERTFAYHFPDAQEYFDALVSQPWPQGPFIRDRNEFIDAVTGAFVAAEDVEPFELIGAMEGADWQIITDDPNLRRLTRELLVRSRVMAEPGLAERLAQSLYRDHEAQFLTLYAAVLERIERGVLDGFDLREIKMVLEAIAEGLQMRAHVDPEAVADTLSTRAIQCTVYALTCGADGEIRSMQDLRAAYSHGGALADVGEREVRLACTCHDLLDGTAGEPATWSALAARTGHDVVELRQRFPDLSSVRALAFSVHVEEIRRAATRFAEEDPRRALGDGICCLVRRARDDRRCATALVALRATAATEALANVASLVPIGAALAAGGPQDDPSSVAPGELEVMVDVAMALALGQPRLAPAAIAERVLRIAELS